ncbi:hypothetical protein [Georgenia sp. AZ-5]|uniref:hypothetical protein n=1 Tax=Georgenia sp. AZ-5 TaxID=3367526 RepID=UPI003754FF7B
MSSTGEDLAVARAVRALRTTLMVCAGACLALGAMGLAIALLTGTGGPVLPGLTMLAAGQSVALAAAAVAGLGLRRVLRGAEPHAVTTAVRARLGTCERVLAAALVLGGAGWVALRPGAVVAVVACALVSAQLAVVLHLLRR